MATDCNNFHKKKDYLICVDSDGCAMDAMEIKHKKCFGPCLIAQWNLYPWEGPILQLWNEINLYSMTRGINRFKGLAAALCEVDRRFTPIADLPSLSGWTGKAPQLSNQALKATIAAHFSPSLSKALNWSISVNRSIAALPPKAIAPFQGVRESLQAASRQADIAMVSSANRDAVTEEWNRYGLIDSLDTILTQDCGSKADCIASLLQKGYAPDHVLMIGDAPGDLQAARSNHVMFFPILVQRESASWKHFREQILSAFTSGLYAEKEPEEEKQFIRNLSHSAG